MRTFTITLNVPLLDHTELALDGYVEPTAEVIRQYCDRLCGQFNHMASVVECMMGLGWSVAGAPTRPVLTKQHESIESARAEVMENGFGREIVDSIVEAPMEMAGTGI